MKNKKNIILFSCLIILFVLSFLFDNIINNIFLRISQVSLQNIFLNNFLDFINNWVFLGFLGFISIVMCFFYINKRKGINLGLSYFFSLFLVSILKLLIERPRPFFSIDYNSFPSAHAAFVFAPVFFLRGKIRKLWIVFAIIISISRIYLGKHYFSDVLFGVLIGLGFSYFLNKSKTSFSKKKDKEIKFCPKCQNKDIILIAGGKIGTYQCKKCGFQSGLFPMAKTKNKRKNKRKKI